MKEGVHTLLDRILLKDTSTSRGLYSRLSRVEKRSAFLKYASALLQRDCLVRNILVDLLSSCVYDSCENEGRLEAPGDVGSATTKKKRQPFMQKVIGDAFAEMFADKMGSGEGSEPELIELVTMLQRQRAPAEVVSAALSRMRAHWLGASVVTYHARIAESLIAPAVIYDECLAMDFGVDYFLPPIPTFTGEDERHLVEAIEIDYQEAGKETVFAANLRKALKLVKQSRGKGGFPSSTTSPGVLQQQQQNEHEEGEHCGGGGELGLFYISSGPPFESGSLAPLESYLTSNKLTIPKPAVDPPLPSEYQPFAYALPSPISSCVSRVKKNWIPTPAGPTTTGVGSPPPLATGRGPLGGWWCDLRWLQRGGGGFSVSGGTSGNSSGGGGGGNLSIQQGGGKSGSGGGGLAWVAAYFVSLTHPPSSNTFAQNPLTGESFGTKRLKFLSSYVPRSVISLQMRCANSLITPLSGSPCVVLWGATLLLRESGQSPPATTHTL